MPERYSSPALRWCVALSLAVSAASAATRTVGPSGTYPKPCAAIGAAAEGDVIEIDAAGSYAGDVCQIAKSGLTLRGVKGRPKIDAAGQSSGGKATWVISGNDTTVENVEFSGATVADANGAGIRQEGANLTVRGCYFHDNQDGILAGDNAASQILIEGSEFDHNGAGDGYSHNLYINHVGKLTFQYNWSHRAVEGHLLKSRAAETYVLYNRLTGEADGTESYEIDVPNGGKTYVIGNIVEQGPNTGNPTLLAYQEEGTNAANPSDELFVASNTFVNDRGNGTFVAVGASVTTKVHLVNNVFFGGGTVCTQPGAVESASYTGTSPGFADVAHYDYRLVAGSPCVDGGVGAGQGDGFSLVPSRQYLHPTSSEARGAVGVIDIGAYELGGASADAGTAAGGAPATTGTGGLAGGGSGAGARSGSSGGAMGGAGQSGSAAGGSGSGGAGRGGASASAAGTAGNSAGAGGAAGTDAGVAQRDAGASQSSSCGCRTVGHRANEANQTNERGGAERQRAPASYGVAFLVALAWLRRRARLGASLRAL